MRLRAISKFHWRGNHEVGELFDCPDEIVAKRLIAEGNAEGLADLAPANETAAPEKSEPVTESAPAAEIAVSKPVAKKSVHKKTVKKKN